MPLFVVYARILLVFDQARQLPGSLILDSISISFLLCESHKTMILDASVIIAKKSPSSSHAKPAQFLNKQQYINTIRFGRGWKLNQLINYSIIPFQR